MKRKALRVRVVVIMALLAIAPNVKGWRVLQVSQPPVVPATKELQRTTNWVVITTINHPTKTVKSIAKATGWKVVVVADKKTPKDWQLDNVDILDLEKQKTLNYKIKPLLPYNHYGRKNLGYLWAIQHGATTIYETDDDNELKSDNLPSLLSLEFYVYNVSGAVVCNPYAFFGNPQVWPRGFPLEHIKGAPPCDTFARQPVRPLVLQGLADVDPDVDAIYRLTQPLNITFAGNTPSVVLPHGIMAPFNSQNTIFHGDALWGLLIPVTTTFRVCDIWRGYWVQRLLWEIEGNLAFGPPTVNQVRNPHNLLQDMTEEVDLYAKAGDLVKLLISWHAPNGMKLPDLIVNLAQLMADKGFWEQGDAELARAWVEDLKAVGYHFPTRVSRRQTGRAAVRAFVPSPSRTPLYWRRHNDIVLVIVFNTMYPGLLKTYEVLREAYRPLFSTIIWTGDNRPKDLPGDEVWVECDGKGGTIMQACLANVMQEVVAAPGGGYLMIGDDTMFDHCQMAAFDPHKVWFNRIVEPKEESIRKFLDDMAAKGNPLVWGFSHDFVTRLHEVFKRFMEGRLKNRFGTRIKQKLGPNLEEVHFGGDYTDGFYLPAHLATDFQLASSHFSQLDIYAEMAIPAILGLITNGAQDFEVIKPLYYWNSRHVVMNEPGRFLKPKGQLIGHAFILHPFKLSVGNASQVFQEWWEGSSCLEEPEFDKAWKGTSGIGVGEEGYKREDEDQKYNDVYV